MDVGGDARDGHPGDSDAPLQVSCRAADGGLNTVGAPGSSRPLTGGGGVVGGVAGGAAMGAAVGATALAFIPVLGILVLATGAAAGAVTGQTIESHARALRYPERIDVPMSCPLEPAVGDGRGTGCATRRRGARVVKGGDGVDRLG